MSRSARRPLQPPASAASRKQAGFTLLEVIVALAIAMPALAMLYGQGLVSMGIVRAAAAHQEAISRAQSRLDTLTGRALATGEQAGDDGGGYHWRTRITPIASTAPPRVAGGGAPAPVGATLFSVVVEMSWAGPNGVQSLVVDTRRLGPAANSLP